MSKLIDAADLVAMGLYASEEVVYKMKRYNRLPFVFIKHGSRLLFDEADVLAYIEDKKADARRRLDAALAEAEKDWLAR